MSVMVDYMRESVKRECEGIDEEEEDEKKESEGRSFMAKLFTPLPYDLVSPLPLSVSLWTPTTPSPSIGPSSFLSPSDRQWLG